MVIQINSAKHIQLHADKIDAWSEELKSSLSRFADQISRIEVHVTDENSAAKEGADDIRCLIEARLNGRQPVSVEVRSENPPLAFKQATEALHRRLEHLLDKERTLKRKGQRDASRKETL